MKWRLLLLPFSLLYNGITRFRNHLYNIGHKPSFRFEVPVISVGNLRVGGSGKTPMIEYLIRLLSKSHHIATLSRGYGRRTRGVRFATAQDDAISIGDEPLQFFRKFSDSVKVVVGEDRALAIPTLLNEHPEVDLILLDDAFQHRAIRPWFSILVSEYAHVFTKDFVLPAGNLREARRGAARADVIVITKCPDNIIDEVSIVSSVKKYAGDKPVFFSSIQYGEPVAFGNDPKIRQKVVLLTGIAHPEPLVDHIKQHHELMRHFRFADHHRYSADEVKSVCDYLERNGASLVTTEKDMARLQTDSLKHLVIDHSCFYIPIEIAFLKNGSEFDELVRRSMKAPIFAS